MCAASEFGIAIVVAVVVATGAFADMTPQSCPDTEPPRAEREYNQTGLDSIHSSGPLPGLGAVDWNPASMAFLPTAGADVALPGATQKPLHLLTDDRSSLDLCLYALMGLGLCRSAPWMRKLSIGHIPPWYHAGGPCQIGHSHAVGPDCLCAAATCFVQPDCRTEDSPPQYRLGVIVSLWRKSQFTPTAFASRGPPLC